MPQQWSGEIVCLRCNHKNTADALKCAWCGAPLSPDVTTIRINRSAVEPRPTDVPRPTESAEGFSLYIAGEVQPLTISGRDRFILGRLTKEEEPTIVDLTPYNAGLLGVSRRHARIMLAEGAPTIEDLGSTNGTWLNEKRLPAHTPSLLHNGDQVRLGQLIVFVYFASQPARQILLLKDQQATVQAAQQATPHYLATNVSPYLKAIIGIQYVIDELHERAPTQVDIETIDVDVQNAVIRVRLGGAQEAIALVHAEVPSWKRQHSGLIRRLQALEDTAPAQPEEERLEQEKLQQELHEAQIELAKTLIGKIKGEAFAGNGHTFVEQLLPHLHTLALSTLEIYANDRRPDRPDSWQTTVL